MFRISLPRRRKPLHAPRHEWLLGSIVTSEAVGRKWVVRMLHLLPISGWSLWESVSREETTTIITGILSGVHHSRIWTLPRWNDGLSFPDEGLLSKRVCIGSIAPPYICAYRRAGIFCGLLCVLDQKSRWWQKDGNAAKRRAWDLSLFQDARGKWLETQFIALVPRRTLWKEFTISI